MNMRNRRYPFQYFICSVIGSMPRPFACIAWFTKRLNVVNTITSAMCNWNDMVNSQFVGRPTSQTFILRKFTHFQKIVMRMTARNSLSSYIFAIIYFLSSRTPSIYPKIYFRLFLNVRAPCVFLYSRRISRMQFLQTGVSLSRVLACL